MEWRREFEIKHLKTPPCADLTLNRKRSGEGGCRGGQLPCEESGWAGPGLGITYQGPWTPNQPRLDSLAPASAYLPQTATRALRPQAAPPPPPLLTSSNHSDPTGWGGNTSLRTGQNTSDDNRRVSGQQKNKGLQYHMLPRVAIESRRSRSTGRRTFSVTGPTTGALRASPPRYAFIWF